MKLCIIAILAVTGTELRQHALCDSFPIHEATTRLLVGKGEMHDIALFYRHGCEVYKHLTRRPIPGEDVPSSACDIGRIGPHLLKESREKRTHLFLLRDWIRRRRLPREKKEIGFFSRSQPEGMCETLKHLSGDVDVSSLFQPRIPRHANACKLSNFLSSQSRRFAARYTRQPHFFR